MLGLDAWITGEGCCTYCGQRRCVCPPEKDEEVDPGVEEWPASLAEDEQPEKEIENE